MNMELSPPQTAFILNDLRRRGVHLKELQEDLLDHLCCLVENELRGGSDFLSAYDRALAEFESLRKLQRDIKLELESIQNQKVANKLPEFLLALGYCFLSLAGVLFPLWLTWSLGNPDALVLFFPFISGGLYILIKRIDYRRMEIRPFRKSVFPQSLLP